jgi:hypothetical protein
MANGHRRSARAPDSEPHLNDMTHPPRDECYCRHRRRCRRLRHSPVSWPRRAAPCCCWTVAPATAGASFGNVGHIATEQVETLPSKQLLLGFWRQLFAFDGALDIPLRRVMSLSPWLARFAVAAFRQESNTRHLAPLVRVTPPIRWSALLGDHRPQRPVAAQWSLRGVARAKAPIGAATRAREDQRRPTWGAYRRLRTVELLRTVSPPRPVARPAAGLWFPDSAHVLDPAEVARAFATTPSNTALDPSAPKCGSYNRSRNTIDITTDTGRILVPTRHRLCRRMVRRPARPFRPARAAGSRARLPHRAARSPPLADAPLVYADQKVAVTPWPAACGRRATSSWPGSMRRRIRASRRACAPSCATLGYRCDSEGPSWMGPRPTLPDYLPGIGRAPERPICSMRWDTNISDSRSPLSPRS